MKFGKKRERVLRLLAAVVVWLGAVGGLLAVITGVAWALQAPGTAALGTVLGIIGSIWIMALLVGAYVDSRRR